MLLLASERNLIGNGWKWKLLKSKILSAYVVRMQPMDSVPHSRCFENNFFSPNVFSMHSSSWFGWNDGLQIIKMKDASLFPFSHQMNWPNTTVLRNWYIYCSDKKGDLLVKIIIFCKRNPFQDEIIVCIYLNQSSTLVGKSDSILHIMTGFPTHKVSLYSRRPGKVNMWDV